MARSSYGHASRPREHSSDAPRMVRTMSAYPPPDTAWRAMPTDAGGRRVFSGAVSDDRPGRFLVRGFVPSHTATPAAASSSAAATEAVESTTHAAQAAAAAMSTSAVREAAAIVGQGASQGATQSRFQLSPAATAFSLGVGGGGGGGRGSQSGSESESQSPLGRTHLLAESRARLQVLQRSFAPQQQQQQQPADGNARGEFFAAVAAARAIAAGHRPNGEDAAAAPATPPGGDATVRSYGQGERAPAPGQRQIDDAYRELLSARASYMAALSSVSPDVTSPRVGTAAAATGGIVASGGGADGDRQRDLSAMLPAFRRWEARRPRLQIQVSGRCFCKCNPPKFGLCDP